MPDHPYKIIIYTKPACVQCNYTKKWLRERGIEFEAYDITKPENEKGLNKIQRWDYKQVPVTVLRYKSNNRIVEHWAGYQISKLEHYFPKDQFPRIKK